MRKPVLLALSLAFLVSAQSALAADDAGNFGTPIKSGVSVSFPDSSATFQPTPEALARAHVEGTRRTDKAEGDRAAGMMAALLNSPNHLKGVQAWYKQRLEGIDTDSPEGRRIRLAFIACEGAFMLRYFGFMKISQQEWRELFADILALMDGAVPAMPAPSGA